MELVEAEARVAAGATWLDENGPEGWMGRIALPHLKINSPFMCVLGQVYDVACEAGRPGYSYAVSELLGESRTVPLGFNSDAELATHRLTEMEMLTEVWRRYIAVKRDGLELAA